MKPLLPLLILVPLLVGCAQFGPPSGGPEDKTPPAIVEVVPAHGSTAVDTATSVRIVFSERVSKTTLRPAFGMSPPPPGTVRSSWDGPDEVTLEFDPPLRDDRTYVITLGTQLADERRNQLQETAIVAFSTGDSLDSAFLTGSLVGPEDPLGWSILGYFLGPTRDVTHEDDDSTWAYSGPDPSADAPDATTQTGQYGSWRLTHMKQGWWRVFAFKDQDADRLWTPWLESLAVPPFDVYASSDTTRTPRPVYLQPSPPVVLPQVARVQAQLKDLFLVRFDRAPHELDVEFSLTDPPPPEEPEPGEPVEQDDEPRDWKVVPASFEIGVSRLSVVPGDSSSLRVQFESPVLGELIGLRVRGSFGTKDTLDTTVTVDLEHATLLDTLPPVLVAVDPPEKSRIHPGRNRLEWVFNEPVSLHSDSGFVQRSSSDTLRPAVQLPAANRFAVNLPDTLAGGAVTFELLGRYVTDTAGNSLRDSVLTWSFAWLPEDSLGTVSGTITAPDTAAAVHLSFHEAFGGQLPLRITLPAPGPFTLTRVPAAQWVVRGWQDVNGNGSWDAGTPLPYVPSDPILLSSDTVSVRARWETGGVRVIFP